MPRQKQPNSKRRLNWDLEKEDVLEAIKYAAWRMQEREVPFSIAIWYG